MEIRFLAGAIIAFTVIFAIFAVSHVFLRVKGNAESMIYHLPECPSYKLVQMSGDDRWFRTEAAAEEMGFRKAKNCPK